MEYFIGIDLGTSTSEISVFENNNVKVLADNKGQIIIDSAIAYYDDKIYIGSSAKEIRKMNPDNAIIEFKRDMGNDIEYELNKNLKLDPVLASALLLKYMRHIANINEYDFDEVVITIPANFSQPARYATLLAAEIAGIKVLRLINEPTSAILSYSFDEKFSKKFSKIKPVLVFDFGGGTLDLTILEAQSFDSNIIYNVIASYGDPFLGGKDIDEEIAKYIFKQIKGNVNVLVEKEIKELSERIKIEVSTKGEYIVKKPINFDYTYHYKFTLNEITKMIQNGDKNILFKISNVLNGIIERATKNHSLNLNEIEIILVGGSCKFPPVKKLVEEFFNKPLNLIDDPQLSVSKGAAIAAALEKQAIVGDIVLVDVAPFGIGLEVLTEINQTLEKRYAPLIQPNTTIPYEVTRRFYLLHPKQEALDVKIYQTYDYAEEGTPLNKIQATPLSIKMSDIPFSTNDKPHSAFVKFRYNLSGLIEIDVEISNNNNNNAIKKGEFVFTPSNLNYDKKALQRMKSKLNELWKKVVLS